MLVHAYLTNGFYEMAKVFLASLDRVQGSSAPLVWLDARGLTMAEIQGLYGCYDPDRLFVNELNLPIKVWAAQAGVSVADMKEYKRQCEQRFVSNRNKVWKLMTAGDDRVARLYDILWPQPDMVYNLKGKMPWWGTKVSYVAHFDIDTLFRRPLQGIPALLGEHDIWLKLRPNHKTLKARITIDCMLIRPTKGVRKFFDRWRHHINRVEPAHRPIGWGQASCWYAFQDVINELDYAKLPLEYGLPGRNHPDDVIWTGNVHKLAKADCVKLFKREMG